MRRVIRSFGIYGFLFYVSEGKRMCREVRLCAKGEVGRMRSEWM